MCFGTKYPENGKHEARPPLSPPPHREEVDRAAQRTASAKTRPALVQTLWSPEFGDSKLPGNLQAAAIPAGLIRVLAQEHFGLDAVHT